jgi:hypothetical protein
MLVLKRFRHAAVAIGGIELAGQIMNGQLPNGKAGGEPPGYRKSGKPPWLYKRNFLNRIEKTTRVRSDPEFAPEPATLLTCRSSTQNRQRYNKPAKISCAGDPESFKSGSEQKESLYSFLRKVTCKTPPARCDEIVRRWPHRRRTQPQKARIDTRQLRG